jgi:transcriptional regulator GlxA family with amidase domain
MNRRSFLTRSASIGAALTVLPASSALMGADSTKPDSSVENSKNKLNVPEKGIIPVAFLISEGVTVIDFAGPWEVFQDAVSPGDTGFHLFTVSEKIETLTGSAGLKLVPDFTFANAPEPKIVVIPAQKGSDAGREWLRKISPATDVTMSVCTGAFQLAKAGLLDGKSATTHHDFFDKLEKGFPKVKVVRGVRFVEGERISTAGGLTSGIDLALRVVERYFGRKVAEDTALYMEYQSRGWIT